MKEGLRKWYHSWKSEFANHKYLILLSLGFFVLANIMSFLASSYVDKIATTTANDLILDHIPTLDLDAIFGYGLIIVILVTVIYVVFFQMRRAHVVTLQFGLLILVRSCFIVLTHLGRPASAGALTDLPAIYTFFNFHNDLFFSAHTAIPFMAFLLFRKEKIGIFFLIMTAILDATVLFLHVHYSIDVFSAFFITFGTYKTGELFCKKFYHYE
jgi:hypothetical protein